MAATVTADFGSVRPNSSFNRWMGSSHIWIRDPTELGEADWQLLADVPPDSARCFVRLEQWAETAWTSADGIGGLDTDPQPNFTLGDSWITEFVARGIEIQIIHEGLADLSWMSVDSGSFASADLDVYEDLLFEIFRYIKTAAPTTTIAEMLNEPFIAINGNFNGSQVFELFRRAASAVTRVNALGLPGPALRTAGPGATITPWENGDIEDLVDAIEANPTAWANEILPVLEYWSAHTFQNKNNVDRVIDGLNATDTYIAGTTYPTMLDGTARTMTAYSRESNVSTDPNDGFGDDEDPSPAHMARGVTMFRHFHHFAHEYQSPAGDRFSPVRHTMFSFQNYVDYGTSYLRTNELSGNHQVSWASVPGAITPYYNLAKLEQIVADGQADGERCAATGTGADSWEVNGAATKHGVAADAIRRVGSGKAWVFLSRHALNNLSSTTVTVELEDLTAAGIDTGQPMTYDVWTIDTDHSNIGNGAANSALEKTVDGATLTAGTPTTLDVAMEAPAVHLIQVNGTAIQGAGPPDGTVSVLNTAYFNPGA